MKKSQLYLNIKGHDLKQTKHGGEALRKKPQCEDFMEAFVVQICLTPLLLCKQFY